MRLNKFIAAHTEYSRRAADDLVAKGRVVVNGKNAESGQDVSEHDSVKIDGKDIDVQQSGIVTLMMNKPAGYVCSRAGQGSKTVYELLPKELRNLNAVGRLDKESSGLLIFTNDGELANRLTHPRYQKTKVYEVGLSRPLQPLHQQIISDHGVSLEDGPSRFEIQKLDDTGSHLSVTLREGRNRQIRRTFNALGYDVTRLHRVSLGEILLGDLGTGETAFLSGA